MDSDKHEIGLELHDDLINLAQAHRLDPIATGRRRCPSLKLPVTGAATAGQAERPSQALSAQTRAVILLNID
jgi:hypothetical protein